MNEKIVIIDDDEKLSALIADYLLKFGYTVQTYAEPFAGLDGIKEDKPDLIILDVMLPHVDGFEVLRILRKENNLTPVIMLTARGDLTDKVLGLESGADDYLGKPFEPRELVARIQSIIRRAKPQTVSTIIRSGELELNRTKHTVSVSGKEITVTTLEFETLLLFMQSPGKVFDRDELKESLQRAEFDAFDRSVDVLMSRIRKKLGDNPKKPTYFRTVYGSGYVFIGEK